MNIDQLEIEGIAIDTTKSFWIPVYWNTIGDTKWVFQNPLTYGTTDYIGVARQFETKEELKIKCSQAGAMKIWLGFNKIGEAYYIFDPEELANVKFYLEVHWPNQKDFPDEDTYIYKVMTNKQVHLKFSINKPLITDDRFMLIAEEM